MLTLRDLKIKERSIEWRDAGVIFHSRLSDTDSMRVLYWGGDTLS